MQSGRNIDLPTFWMKLSPGMLRMDTEFLTKVVNIFYKTIWRHVLQHNNLHITTVGSSKPTHTRLNLKSSDVLNFNFSIYISDVFILILVNDQLEAQFFFSCMFIPNLYMFRALTCSSSGELIVSIRHLVYVTVCR
jgi:hypothetical protein